MKTECSPAAATISLYLQHELKRRGLAEVPAVEAALWLDRAKILRDSGGRPGLPLRNLLRSGAIVGQRQQGNGRWFIDVVTIDHVVIHRPGSSHGTGRS